MTTFKNDGKVQHTVIDIEGEANVARLRENFTKSPKMKNLKSIINNEVEQAFQKKHHETERIEEESYVSKQVGQLNNTTREQSPRHKLDKTRVIRHIPSIEVEAEPDKNQSLLSSSSAAISTEDMNEGDNDTSLTPGNVYNSENTIDWFHLPDRTTVLSPSASAQPSSSTHDGKEKHSSSSSDRMSTMHSPMSPIGSPIGTNHPANTANSIDSNPDEEHKTGVRCRSTSTEGWTPPRSKLHDSYTFLLERITNNFQTNDDTRQRNEDHPIHNMRGYYHLTRAIILAYLLVVIFCTFLLYLYVGVMVTSHPKPNPNRKGASQQSDQQSNRAGESSLLDADMNNAMRSGGEGVPPYCTKVHMLKEPEQPGHTKR